MMSDSANVRESARPGAPAWREIVAKYQDSSAWRGGWQLVNTLIPYAALWYLMWRCLAVSYWLTAPLAILAGGFLVRAFIIFHDCGHGSFFKSRRANDVVGFITGVLTWTPYHHWRWQHAIHHGSAGDLDRRGVGDIWMWTVQEYLEASRWKRFAYRMARNPAVLFGFAPLYLFFIQQRIPMSQAPPRERRSVHWTNLAILGMAVGLSFAFGLKAYILLQLAVTMVAGAAGIWLFYIQHQFEGVYWKRREDWDYEAAALRGSSFYKLPKVLQWFSGNIGFHHIHHLNPRIPNYRLEKCHRAEPLFQSVKPVTLLSSLKALSYRLWDEQREKLIGYRELARQRLQNARRQA